MKKTLKSAAKFVGDLAEAYVENNKEVTEMTAKLHSMTHGLDPETTKKIAQTLVSHAEVTWKR
jgi:hypothetical protein